jgi:hypothetical protein
LKDFEAVRAANSPPLPRCPSEDYFVLLPDFIVAMINLVNSSLGLRLHPEFAEEAMLTLKSGNLD